MHKVNNVKSNRSFLFFIFFSQVRKDPELIGVFSFGRRLLFFRLDAVALAPVLLFAIFGLHFLVDALHLTLVVNGIVFLDDPRNDRGHFEESRFDRIDQGDAEVILSLKLRDFHFQIDLNRVNPEISLAFAKADVGKIETVFHHNSYALSSAKPMLSWGRFEKVLLLSHIYYNANNIVFAYDSIKLEAPQRGGNCWSACFVLQLCYNAKSLELQI